MKRSLILTVLSFLILAQLSLAQVPQTINHQGVLRDASGDIVDDGVYTLTFKLWNAAEGGTKLWSEAQSVTVIDGIFNAVLGTSTTFSSVGADFESPYWLEMIIEAGPGVTGPEFLSPRIELTAVPYAIKSRGVAGSTNVFPSSGSVGIGTLAPSAKLDVAGNANIQGNLDVQGTITQGSQTEYYSFGVRDANSTGDENYLKAYVMAPDIPKPINTTIPVHLPQGATITDITIHVNDDDGTYDATCSLYALVGASFTQTEGPMTPIDDVSSTGTGKQSPTTTLSTPHTVDNQTNIYWLRIYAGAGTLGGPSILFYGGYITYTVN